MENSLTRAQVENLEYIRMRHDNMYSREDVENAIRALWAEGNLASARCAGEFRVIEKAMKCYARKDADKIISDIRLLILNREPINDIFALIPSNVKTKEELLVEFVNDIFDLYEEMYTPEDYMRRLVNRLIEPDIAPGENGSVRLAIFKHFLRHADYGVTAANSFFIKRMAQENFDKAFPNGRASKQQKTAFVLARVDDSVFDEAENAAAAGENVPEIISLADCLGSGRFRTLGGTKKFLYMFAIAFNMTYYTGGIGEVYDPGRDIVRNLFEDYYSNNLLRDMVEVHQSKGVETMPSGSGINFKNAIEVAFLYVIKRTDLTPDKKFKLFNDITKAFSSFRGEPKDMLDIPNPRLYSEVCKKRAISLFEEMGLEAGKEEGPSAEEVAERIGTFCSTSENNINTSSDQKRAYNNYRFIVERIKEWHPNEEVTKVLQPTLESANGQYWSRYFSVPSDLEREEVIDDAVERFIGIMTDENLFGLTDPNKISRFQLMAVYFYFFCEQHRGTRESFSGLYDRFANGVNLVLEDSNYQTLNEKNFFDMLVVANVFVVCAAAEGKNTPPAAQK